MSSDLSFPIQYGKYQLLERIAQGGMADVYLARTFGVEGFEKRLVIKRILPGLQKSPHFVQLFINEARISVCLNHPNIVQVYELGREEGGHFIAMEHIHGRDLTRVVRALRAQGRRLPIPLAVYVVASAVRGLAHAHELADQQGHPLGLVHGDVSPHNLVVSFTGEVKIVDFGIARLAGTGWGDKMGRPGGGKFAYMSPEQVGGLSIDARSDVFSAGIVLYELLVDHRLYQHPDPEEKLRLVREAIVPDPRLENPEIPDDLWRILQKALQRHPGDRYEGAQPFEEALRGFLFQEHLRADATAMSAFMADLFGEEDTIDPAAAEVGRVARELMQRQEPAQASVAAQASAVSSTDARPLDEPPGAAQGEELRIVTVMTVEMSGNTEPSQNADPNELVAAERELQAWLRRQAHRFGGLLMASSDDSFVILFGVTRTRVDDPERAIACARDSLERMRSSKSQLPSLEFCVGIHQGEASIGHVTEQGLPRVTGRGDTLRLARKLAGATSPGQILVSDRVARQVRDGFLLEPAPPLSHRGREAEIRVWTVREPRTRSALMEAGRWLQRGRELDELRDALFSLGRGQGRLLVLTGESGLGKSRLVRETIQMSLSPGIRCIAVKAAPFGSDLPFPLLRELVAAIVGPSAGMRADRVALGKLGMDEADAAILASLLSPTAARRLTSTREMAFEAVNRLLRATSAQGAMLLVIEDVHLLDILEREFLGRISRLVAERPVMALVTTSELPPEELRQASGVIHLLPLTRLAQTALLVEKLGVQEIDPRLTELLHVASAGNPHLVLEALSALERDSLIESDGSKASLRALPQGQESSQTLRVFLAARIDALEPETRLMLRLAAVMGQEFPRDLLFSAMTAPSGARGSEPPQLARLLLQLVEQGFLRETEGRGTSESVEADPREPAFRYEFGSPDLWEATMRGIMGPQRRALHRRVAGAMESQAHLHGEGLELLADHAAAGGSLNVAIQHIMRAAEDHAGEGALERALGCFERGLGWYEELLQKESRESLGGPTDPGIVDERSTSGWTPSTPSLSRGVGYRRRAGEIALALGQLRKAEHHLQLALDEAADSAMPEEEAACCLGLSRVCLYAGRRTEAQAYLDQAQTASQSNGLEKLLLRCLEARGEQALDAGLVGEAELICENLLLRSADWPEIQASAQIGLARVARRRDQLDSARERLSLASSLVIRGQTILDGRIARELGLVELLSGDLDRACRELKRAVEIQMRTGARIALCRSILDLGQVHLLLGETAQAESAFEQGHDLARSIGWPRGIATSEAFLGYLEARRGEDQRIAVMERAIAQAARIGCPDIEVLGRWLRALWLAEQAETESALVELDQLVELAQRQELRGYARRILEDRRRLAAF